ncbi:hypothetical protein MXB_5712, partial [Myxobolus squamalis]
MLELLIFFCLAINLFDQLTIENSVLNREWDDYKSKYKLKFSGEEEMVRKETFLQNYQFIIDTNAKNLNFTLGMNQFGHLKKNEIARHLMQKEVPKAFQNHSPNIVGGFIPKKFDWREKDVVSEVKNQFDCGCGYAFSATGAIESAYAIKKKKCPSLSEQDIVSCSRKFGNRGCHGGLPELGFFYAIYQGISTSTDYPYTADYKESPCHQKEIKDVYKIKRYGTIDKGDELNLIEILFSTGPISINLDMDHAEFLFYKGGVLNIPSCSSKNLNHAALAVGYNLENNNKRYLIVKNSILSFGSEWGEKGYFNIELFKGNMCGISTR